MSKLALQMQISVDGFIAGPNGEIDWIFKTMDGGATAWIVDMLWRAGVHIMGSRTYQDMAAYWPSSEEPFAAPMNEIPKVIFSRKGVLDSRSAEKTTKALENAFENRPSNGPTSSQGVSLMDRSSIERSWTEPSVAGGDLADEIHRLKQQPGKDILAHGGVKFARSLVASGLIDEYRLMTHPVVLGRGLPLFSDLSKPARLHLVSATAFGGGVVAHVYRTQQD
jgi:dihydrofolate reductase